MNTAKTNATTIAEILQFWFGTSHTAVEIAAEKTTLWWSKNEIIDREITGRFAAVSEAAATGKLASWAESPPGLLALILCTDQFPRNMHRDTPGAFACDAVALGYAKQGLESGATACLDPIRRVFAYLPFEHSEDLAEQQRSVALYQELAENAAADEVALFNNYLDFAHKHQQIIQRFARFPHRNQILGRPSTDEELAFLKQPGSSF